MTLTEIDAGRDRDPSRAIGRNIEPFLLFELLRAPSYGYDLIRRLAERGFRRAAAEPGVVYKVLRSLEESGAIRSTWLPQESGPARRYYEITDEGRARLRRRVGYLHRYVERLQSLLADYAALTGEQPGAEMPAEAVAPPVPAGAGRP